MAPFPLRLSLYALCKILNHSNFKLTFATEFHTSNVSSKRSLFGSDRSAVFGYIFLSWLSLTALFIKQKEPNILVFKSLPPLSEPVPGVPGVPCCLQLTTGHTGCPGTWAWPVACAITDAGQHPETTLYCHIVSLSISGPRLGAMTEVRGYDFI